MRTCWMSGREQITVHKSKARWTKRCIRKNSHTHTHENTSSPLWLWQPVAMSYHHFLSITDRETMLRLVGWWTGSPWQHKDLLTAQCEARREARTGSGPLQVHNSGPFWSWCWIIGSFQLLLMSLIDQKTLNEGRSGEGNRLSSISWLLIICCFRVVVQRQNKWDNIDFKSQKI